LSFAFSHTEPEIDANAASRATTPKPVTTRRTSYRNRDREPTPRPGHTYTADPR